MGSDSDFGNGRFPQIVGVAWSGEIGHTFGSRSVMKIQVYFDSLVTALFPDIQLLENVCQFLMGALVSHTSAACSGALDQCCDTARGPGHSPVVC